MMRQIPPAIPDMNEVLYMDLTQFSNQYLKLLHSITMLNVITSKASKHPPYLLHCYIDVNPNLQ